MIDRQAINRALAKAIAYKACGNDGDAVEWARELVRLLECSAILKPNVWPNRGIERDAD